MTSPFLAERVFSADRPYLRWVGRINYSGAAARGGPCALKGLTHHLHVLLRHRLLRQPHGFEGFVDAQVLPHPHDLSARRPAPRPPASRCRGSTNSSTASRPPSANA